MFGKKISIEEHQEALRVEQEKLSASQDRVTELEGQLTKATENAEAKDATITELQEKVETHEATIADLEAKVAELGGEISEKKPNDPPSKKGDKLDGEQKENEFFSETDAEVKKAREELGLNA